MAQARRKKNKQTEPVGPFESAFNHASGAIAKSELDRLNGSGETIVVRAGVVHKELLPAMRHAIMKVACFPDEEFGQLDFDTTAQFLGHAQPLERTPTEERVFLAMEHRANGDDDSKFVLAIVTVEENADAAYAKAQQIAAKHGAEIMAGHDGDGFYKLVR